MLGLVDWHLLVLFAALFVVTATFAATGIPAALLSAIGNGQSLGTAAIAALAAAGSFANLIVVERAASQGVRLSFTDHARCGVPMALVSFAGAAGWLWAIGLVF